MKRSCFNPEDLERDYGCLLGDKAVLACCTIVEKALLNRSVWIASFRQVGLGFFWHRSLERDRKREGRDIPCIPQISEPANCRILCNGPPASRMKSSESRTGRMRFQYSIDLARSMRSLSCLSGLPGELPADPRFDLRTYQKYSRRPATWICFHTLRL